MIKKKFLENLWEVIRVISAISLNLIMWAAAFYLVTTSELENASAEKLDFGDLAALLFGASSIALFSVSLVVALLAVFGWQAIQRMILDKVAEATNAKVKMLEIEMRGRMVAALGYFTGEMAMQSGILKPSDPIKLADAIRQCEKGYSILGELAGPAKYLSLNNFLFYSCVQGGQSRPRADFLLKRADELLAASQDKDVVNPQLTACRVILEFSEVQADRERARKIIENMLNHPDITDKEADEANLYLKHYFGDSKGQVRGGYGKGKGTTGQPKRTQ